MGKSFRKCINNRLCGIVLLIFMLLPTVLRANLSQNKTVSGIVTSASDGESLIGVNVQVKGTTIGTSTDIDGRYSISVSSGETLLFSYIGYKNQEIVIGNQATLNVALEEDSEILDEVVVVGYGVQKKKLVTGATIQVKGDELQKLNTTSPLQAMQGQTPGVNIASTSGQPGSDMKVTIRGLGTVGNSSPLYLIDGIGGDISTLNPADIESIDILKDAASAAIYGAQAANGVVLITTKSGKEGKAQVSFDAYYGIQNVARTTKMLNAEQYKTIMDEQSINSGGGVFDWDSFASIKGVDTDWIDKMFTDNAETQSYTLGVTGGSPTSTYAISLGYLSQEGIVGGKDISNYERYNFRINSEHKLFNNFLKVGEHVSFIYKATKGISVGNQYNNTLRGAFGVSPLAPIYSDNNIYDFPYNDTSNSDWFNGDGNPYGIMMINTNNKDKNRTFAGDVYAEIEPIKNLKLRTVFGTVYNASEYRSFTPLYQLSIYAYNNTRTSVSQNMNQGMSLTWTNTATYDFSVDKHKFNTLLGMESSRYDGSYLGAGSGSLKEGFDNWSHAWIDNATSTSKDDGLSANGSPHGSNRSVSYFGRLGWNYQEKYMLNATLRADGSSRFARGHRFGYFPSVSAGWVITNEQFMQKTSDWMSYLKIRGSWGQVGNQNITANQFVSPIKTSTTNYIFGTSYGAEAQANYWGAYPSRLANEKVKWETSEQINIGVDTYFIKHLSLNADFYIKTTKDWLVQAPILATAGTGAPYINGGDVKNTGVELALTWDDNIGKDFNYHVTVNGAYNKNSVGKIPTVDGIIHGSTNQLYDNTPEFYRAQNGHAIGYFWGYKTAGIFQNQEEIDAWKTAGNGILQSDVKPGDVKYLDLNHYDVDGNIVLGADGIINDADKVDIGNGMPDFTFGFNVGFTYKNFDFSVYANGVAGNEIVQSYRTYSNKQANYTTAILNRWTGEGTSNKIPRVTEVNINWQFSDLFLQKGDFLRINNVTVGYDFAKLINNKYFGQARLYVQAQNLLTFTKYDGMDPEIGYGTEDSGWVSGIDLGYYPRPRTVLFGVNLKF
ncbi:MAG: TonB-dependent receptor [Tannerellaceae bacterium]|jgi:TonB-linked SusC/RagA family outer membrane protein|nr:TonB-dependent receptor [Tannerellaceae bacterium]